jgi:hypothetical protein
MIGCGPMFDSLKYMTTGKGAEVPARTIDAAKEQFKDESMVVGQSTENDLKSLLGSPSEIRKEDGNNIYVYTKNVSTKGVSADVGTTYHASYSFGKNGKLKDKQYKASAMGNPLTGQ